MPTDRPDDIERRIVTGLIVSDEFVRQVSRFWRDDLLMTPERRRVARWCVDHFERYGRAPDRDIEAIYTEAIKAEAIDRAEAELIERMLHLISDEYGRGERFNAAYLYDRTVAHLRKRELTLHAETLLDEVDRGDVERADEAARTFRPTGYATSRGLELSGEDGLARIEAAFSSTRQPVVGYPGALGVMLNDQLVRDALVAFEAPEKRGKTFLMIDVAVRAVIQRSNVAFFQAGDLTESQFLRRFAVHVAGRSDDPRYCAAHWRPVGDCVKNQFDTCGRDDRNCRFGVYDGGDRVSDFYDKREEYENLKNLTELAEANPEYETCKSRTCTERLPTVWLERVEECLPLTGASARQHVERFFSKHKRRFHLEARPSGTITCEYINSCLDEWERQDDFVPDVIVVDYADIMTANVPEFRHRQNAIWMGLRAISQERHALVLTATQADAASYRQNRLGLGNFSEDKRKHSHVTAMYALNQSPDGREKALGLLRVGELLVREGAFSIDNEVVVLQHLAAGRAFTGSHKR